MFAHPLPCSVYVVNFFVDHNRAFQFRDSQSNLTLTRLSEMINVWHLVPSLCLLLLLSFSGYGHGKEVTAGSFSPSQYFALEDLYNSTSGPNWYWQKPYSFYGIPWNFHGLSSTNPCEERWQGLACSIDNSSITGIELSNDLHGQLPVSLDRFVDLSTLNLARNRLTGKFFTFFFLLVLNPCFT